MSYPQCITCEWYKGVGCKAFPTGIPDDITHNEFDHRNRYPGDHDIQYVEKIERTNYVAKEASYSKPIDNRKIL